MKIQKRCLHCGAPNNSINYTCPCQATQWTNEYRALDIDLDWDDAERDRIRSSYYNFHFDHPDGMLQYAGLPYRQYQPHFFEAVGMTKLHYLAQLSSDMGCQVFLKNEGNNPSGCFKDRETVMCLLNSIRRHLRNAVIYSSGNAAASAAIFAQRIDFHLVTIVAGDTYPEKIDFIRHHGSDVIVTGDGHTNFETGFRLFAAINAQGAFSNAGYDNWSVRNPYRVQGDKTTALELVKQLSDGGAATVPDYVIVPTANGSCLAGIWKGFIELKELGIIDRLPKMVSVGIKNASPVFKAVMEKETTMPVRCDLSKLDADDAEIGSIILAEEGYDSIEAAKAVLHSGGTAIVVQRSDMEESLAHLLETEHDMVAKEAILPEPASVTSLAALKKLKTQIRLSENDRVVAIMTGHGMKARTLIDEMLEERSDLQNLVTEIAQQKKEDMVHDAKRMGQRVDVKADYDAVVEAFMQLKRDK